MHPGILFQALKDGLYQTWDLDHEVVIANMAHGRYTEINLLYAPIAARHVHSRDKKRRDKQGQIRRYSARLYDYYIITGRLRIRLNRTPYCHS